MIPVAHARSIRSGLFCIRYIPQKRFSGFVQGSYTIR